MIPGKLMLDDRRMRYAVTDNEDAHGPEGADSPPIWAVNLHGYFAGGGMYWRESKHLAETLGWRVVNPNLPGFAGSDPLPWERVSIQELTNEIVRLLDHLGIEQVVLLGHSMGGAVAVQFADAHPERTLGIIYRDGAATPEWKVRHGMLVSLISPVLPDVAGVADLMVAVMLDTPGVLIGRRLPSTLRGLWPDARRNLRTMGRSLPVGSMLMAIDLRPGVRHIVEEAVPVLPIWGCFDRIVNAACAQEFSDLVHRPVVWVPGGHSWMLPRPQAQADILRYLGNGRRFMADVLVRRRHLLGLDAPHRATFLSASH
ncbi:MAG TPA: alpha/beta fold hydrolase [Acidimicrobiales bacterium]|jgi:pimeloyl-ACP methyl ester carboxylesterase